VGRERITTFADETPAIRVFHFSVGWRAREWPAGLFLAKIWCVYGELLTFAIPKLLSDRPGGRIVINCPLHGGGSVNARAVTQKTEDT
jgi:hypothetical protein